MVPPHLLVTVYMLHRLLKFCEFMSDPHTRECIKLINSIPLYGDNLIVNISIIWFISFWISKHTILQKVILSKVIFP